MPKKRTDAQLATLICHAIRSATAARSRRSRGVQWASLQVLKKGLDVSDDDLARAIAYAVGEDWLDVDPGKPPHSVCLAAGYWRELAA